MSDTAFRWTLFLLVCGMGLAMGFAIVLGAVAASGDKTQNEIINSHQLRKARRAGL